MGEQQQRSHLVTFGITPAQQQQIADIGVELSWSDVPIDMTSSDTIDPALLMLAVVDAVDLQGGPEPSIVAGWQPPPAVVLVGPYAFGFASIGKLRDLRDWAVVRAETLTLIVCPDPEDHETHTQTSSVQAALRARIGLRVDVEAGRLHLLDALGMRV